MAEDRDIMSVWTTFALEPLDTLLFRDGRPFDQSDEGLTETRSLFPPFPSTVAGAIRARLAREMGWTGRGGWTEITNGVLGSGPVDAGLLRFGPPVVLLAVPDKDPKAAHFQPLFPCPATLHGRFNPESDPPGTLVELAVTLPKARLDTDMGDAQFCGLDKPDLFEPLDDWLINRSGLQAFLKGEIPAPHHVTRLGDLLTRQNRAGLKRDYAAHGAEAGMLYTASYMRLQQQRVGRSKEGKSKMGRVAIGVAADLSALGGKYAIPKDAILPFGSMGRAASCCAGTFDLAAPSIDAPGKDGTFLYSLLLLSPALPHGSPREAKGGLPLPEGHELISAAIRKPIAFSGWNAKNNEPAAMQRYYAPGSTWFVRFEGKAADLREAFEKFKTKGISKSKEGGSVGFGAVAIGVWNNAGDRKK
jgi:CRISPR-associated protein Cmr3